MFEIFFQDWFRTSAHIKLSIQSHSLLASFLKKISLEAEMCLQNLSNENTSTSKIGQDLWVKF